MSRLSADADATTRETLDGVGTAYGLPEAELYGAVLRFVASNQDQFEDYLSDVELAEDRESEDSDTDSDPSDDRTDDTDDDDDDGILPSLFDTPLEEDMGDL